MIDITKYKKILEVYDEFPFLDSTIKNHGITSVFSLDDLLNPKIYQYYLRDIYDLYNINSSGGSFFSSYNDKIISAWKILKTNDTEKYFLIKLYIDLLNSAKISFEFDKAMNDIENNNQYIKKLFMDIINLYESFNFKKEQFYFENDYYKTSKYTYEQRLIYAMTIYSDLVIPFFYKFASLSSRTTQKYTINLFLKMFSSDELIKINQIYLDIDELTQIFSNYNYSNNQEFETKYKYLYNLLKNISYISYYITDVSKILNKEMDNIYNYSSTDEIANFKENIYAKLESFYKFYKVNCSRKISILNDKLSDDEKESLLSTFKSSSSIKNLIEDLIKTNSANYDRINFILESCILNNSKIKDRNFPKTKLKVICDTIRGIFITSHSHDIYDVISSSDLLKLAKKYSDYFYNPYFIQSIFNTASVYDDRNIQTVSNSKLLLKYLFKEDEMENYIKKFIIDYIAIIQTPNLNRSNPCSSKVYAHDITYGSLTYFLRNFIKNTKYDESELFDELILKNIILSENKLNKTEVLLFYIVTKNINDLAFNDIMPYTASVDSEVFSRYFNDTILSNVSPFRQMIFLSYYDIGALTKKSYNNFNNVYIQERYGSINNLLASINYSDMYNDDYFRSHAMTLINHRSNYYYDEEYILLNDQYDLRRNAEKYILLRILNLGETICVKYNREDIFNNAIADLKNKINLNNCRKVILTSSSSLGQLIKEDRQTYSSRKKSFTLDNSIDFDTLFKYFDFIKLNKKYNLFDIDDTFENMMFIPQMFSINYAFEKTSRINSYSYNNAAFITKYSPETTSYKVLQSIKKIDDDTSKYIYNKFFQNYIDDDFEYNEYFSSTLLQMADRMYDDGTKSSTSSDNAKNNLKYAMFSDPGDTRTTLINGSIMDTIIRSYFDFFEQIKLENLIGEEKLEELKNKMNQTAIDYECMRSLTI